MRSITEDTYTSTEADAADFERARSRHLYDASDNWPDRADLDDQARSDRQQEGFQRQRDAAARERGHFVPTPGQRSTAADISLTLTRGGMYTRHKVVPVREGVYRVDTETPVTAEHPALASIRGEHKILDGVLWIRDGYLLPVDPPF